MKIYAMVCMSAALLCGVAAQAVRAHDDAPAVVPEAVIPATPAGEKLAWFLSTVEQPSEAAIAEMLGETLNDNPAPTPATLQGSFLRIKSMSDGLVPMRLREVDELELDVLLRAKNKRSWWIATIGVETAESTTLETMLCRPLVEEPGVGAQNWGDITWKLGNRPLPPGLSIRVDRHSPSGSTTPLLRLRTDERVATGPAAMLFPMVLLAEQINDDPELFGQPVPLDRALRSVVSTELAKFTPGEAYEINELLLYALHRGDLTATDQLTGWLGRGHVERLVAEIQGNDSPNLPFMTTGEFFKLKMTENEELVRRFATAEGEDGRREVLGELESEPLPEYEDANLITTPTRVREVEWRASADEMSELVSRLWATLDADSTGQLAEIFNEVSPRNREMGVWSFIFHMSGGEPGVMCDVYMLERLDGARFSFAFMAENPSKEIDVRYFGGLPNTFITLMALED